MNMKKFRNSIFGLGIAVVLCSFLSWGAETSVSPYRIAPYLQNITTDGATIMWETVQPAIGEVHYAPGRGKEPGDNSALPKFLAREDKARKIHRVRLTSLKPGTYYHYTVSFLGETVQGTFRTAPAGDDATVTFVVIGDSRRWGNRVLETGLDKRIREINPDFILNLGDLVRRGHEYDLWPSHFERFGTLLRDYMMVAVRGNHEGARMGENDWFARYYILPGKGEPYATLQWGNTELIDISLENASRTAEWLDKHLAHESKRWVIVSQHYPMICTGYLSPNDSRKEMGETYAPIMRILEKYEVPLDFAGHTHIYERTWPLTEYGIRDEAKGVHYIINGGDIEANYPEYWSAMTDDPATMDQPTYSVVRCLDDCIDVTTFAWLLQEKQYGQIDHVIIWRNEALPKAALDTLKQSGSSPEIQDIEKIGAMQYLPAASVLLPFLKKNQQALRRETALALCRIGNDTVAPQLLKYLNDQDLIVRRRIARSLECAMPASVGDKVAEQVLNAQQDEKVRVTLMGALQLHAPKVGYSTAKTLLQQTECPRALRHRAAYAFGRLATTKDDARFLRRVFKDTQDEYYKTIIKQVAEKVGMGSK